MKMKLYKSFHYLCSQQNHSRVNTWLFRVKGMIQYRMLSYTKEKEEDRNNDNINNKNHYLIVLRLAYFILITHTTTHK